jgi:hypothetical protein
MTRLWIDAVNQELKIFATDADDPDNPGGTPDTHYHKFRFNSNTGLIGYNFGVNRFPYKGFSGSSFGVPVTYSAGAHWRVEATNFGSSGTFERHYFNAQAAFDLPFVPMVEARWRKNGSGWVDHHQFVRADFSVHAPTWFALQSAGIIWAGSGLARADSSGGCFIAEYRSGPNMVLTNLVTETNVEAFAVVWDLPGNTSNPFPPNGTPSTGQLRLRIAPTIAKMTRPGYDIDSASGRQFIFDSDRIPTKILATGEVTIGPGATVNIPINAAFRPLGPFTYVDGMTRRAGEPYQVPPHIPITNEDWTTVGATFRYRPLSDRVQLQNPANYTIHVIYIVYGDDDQGTSSGSGKVFDVQGGSNPGIRIMRPGASASPRLRDVILDTRAGFMPVLATGYLSRGNFSLSSDNQGLGAKRAPDVAFSNAGFRPFLKFAIHTSWGIQPPRAERWYIDRSPNSWDGKYSQTSVIARVENSFVRFYANPDNPNSAWWTGHPSGTPPFPPIVNEVFNSPRFLGVRYYIFGIPTSI